MVRSLWILSPILILGLSCTSDGSGPGEGDIISREAFVQAYVDLRIAALRDPMTQLPLDERDRILQEAGITEADLIRYAEVRGTDVQFMRELWEEVDSIIRAHSQPDDPSTRDDPST